jgi:hypothetical protein
LESYDRQGAEVFEFLVGDFAIVAGVTAVVLAAWRLFPFTVSRILRDKPRSLGILNRGILLAGAATVIWIAVFDNWRQVIGIPTGWIQDDKAQRASDPFYSGDIADPIRAVSWVLFFATVIGGAYLFARFSRGYAEPLILGPISLVFFFVLNTIRLRFDVDSVRIAYGSIDTPLDITTTLIWTFGLWVTMGFITLAMYLMVWAPFALVLSIIYRKFVNREVYEEPPIYRRMRERRMSQAPRS